MGSLVKRLKSECKKSPAKAALLVIVSIVGVVVWGRQFARFVLPKSSGKAVAETLTEEPPTEDQSITDEPGQETVDTTATGSFSWNAVTQWRSRDPLTQPRLLTAATRNPFQVTVVQRQAEIAAENAANSDLELLATDEPEEGNEFNEEERPPSLGDPEFAEQENPTEEGLEVQTPEELGLVLNATIVGSQVKIAQISGQRYRQHDVIQLINGQIIRPDQQPLPPQSSDDSNTIIDDGNQQRDDTVTFELADIRHDHVVLSRDLETYVLRLPRSGHRLGRQLILRGNGTNVQAQTVAPGALDR